MPVDWNSLDYRIRRQPSVKKYEALLQEAYALPNQIQVPFPGEDIADVGNFPKNIQEHFWIREDTAESGDPWMVVGQLSNGNYFFFEGNKAEKSTEIYVTPTFKSLIDFALRDRFKVEYSGGSPTPTFPGEFPVKSTPLGKPYMAWISGTLDPEEAVLTPWERRLAKGLLPCFACTKDFRWKEPGEMMCSGCTDLNRTFLAEARKKEEERQKLRAAAQKA